jgi:tetratricopeptide (TPR) repeat protein
VFAGHKDRTMSISLKTHKMLWSLAAGRCAFPGCRRELFMDASQTDDESLVGEACHIVTQSPTGPRGDPSLTPEQLDHYDNLILLCQVHHKLIDDQPDTYTVQRLLQMKAAHEKWVRVSLGSRPRSLALISDLVPRRNPHFTGRESLLARLRSALTSSQPAALPQAIHGLGGVGKTQLTVEYAYRHAAEYDLVWWVRAEEPAALAADYAALARPLNLPEKDEPDQRLVVQAVRRWLGRHKGWLLVFDHARGPEDLRLYLPPGGAGHILITSRNPHWRGLASPLTVPVLGRPESVAFLLKRTGQTDEAAASRLAQTLGDLPLALEQAGAYIDAIGGSLSAYLDLFRHRQRDLSRRGKPSPDSSHAVAITWEIAFQQVWQDSPAGADLLNLCAYLAPDDIPRDLLGEEARHLPGSLAEAAAALRRYSLIEVSGDAWSVHRLVQAVARDRLTEEARRNWARAAVQIVDSAFPSGDAPQDGRTWSVCARLLPHALAVAGHAEALHVASEATGRLLNQAGLYLWGRSEFAEAKAALERALAIFEKVLGADHPNMATLVNNLGSVLQALGDLAGARAAYERALAIDEAAYDPHHPNVASDVNNLASVMYDLGDLAGARAAYERALAIGEAAFGPHHPNVATAVNNLGKVLLALGDLAGARAAYERALAIDEAAFGPHHPNVVTDLSNLGSVLHDLGDLAGARVAYERVLAIREQDLGEHHPNTATALNDLGTLLHRQGDYAGARIYLERALAVYEQVFGEQHPWVAAAVNNLGSVLQALGDLAGAQAAYERALAIDEAVYGSDHPNVAIDVNNLAGVMYALGDLAGARAAYERALAIDEAAYGPHHPNVATAVNNLGSVLRALGDLAGARAALERALAIDEAAYGSDHPNVATDLSNLGSVLHDLGDLAGARAALERALAMDEAAFGPHHPNVATDLSNLGMVLHDLGDLAGARAALERALQIRQKSLGENHPRTVMVRDKLRSL